MVIGVISPYILTIVIAWFVAHIIKFIISVSKKKNIVLGRMYLCLVVCRVVIAQQCLRYGNDYRFERWYWFGVIRSGGFVRIYCHVRCLESPAIIWRARGSIGTTDKRIRK